MQPRHSERFPGLPAHGEPESTADHRLAVTSAQAGAVLLVCAGVDDQDARAALTVFGGAARATSCHDSALAYVAQSDGGLAAVAILGTVDPAAVLALLERLRARGSRAPVLAAHLALSQRDVTILHDAGVELISGASIERQARNLVERLDAGGVTQAPGLRRGERRQELSLDDLAATGEAMTRIVALGRRMLRGGLPVLIEGEQGVGKFALARALHAAGLRRQRPLRQLDAAMAAGGVAAALDVLGVDLDRGLINGEAGGSLYLRDVNAWPDNAQGQLTELLRRRNLRQGRAGGETSLRIFAASRRPLVDLVREGGFREDLYYLLSVAPLTLTALRNRREDIPALAQAMLARIQNGRLAPADANAPLQLGDDALAALRAEDWPGNVAQLRARILRAALRGDEPLLPASALAPISPAPSSDNWLSPATDAAAPLGDLVSAARNGAGTAQVERPDAAYGGAHGAPGILQIFDGQGELRPLAEIEAGVIRFALRHYRGQMSEVSRRLGIGRSTLYRKLKDLDLLSERAMLDGGDELVTASAAGRQDRVLTAGHRLVDSGAARGWPEAVAAAPS